MIEDDNQLSQDDMTEVNRRMDMLKRKINPAPNSILTSKKYHNSVDESYNIGFRKSKSRTNASVLSVKIDNIEKIAILIAHSCLKAWDEQFQMIDSNLPDSMIDIATDFINQKPEQKPEVFLFENMKKKLDLLWQEKNGQPPKIPDSFTSSSYFKNSTNKIKAFGFRLSLSYPYSLVLCTPKRLEVLLKYKHLQAWDEQFQEHKLKLPETIIEAAEAFHNQSSKQNFSAFLSEHLNDKLDQAKIEKHIMDKKTSSCSQI